MANLLELQPSNDSILIGGKNIMLLANVQSEKRAINGADEKEVIYAGINIYYKTLYVMHK